MFYRFNAFYKFSYDEMLSIVENHCRLYEMILEKHKPDFLLCKEPNSLSLQLLFEICQSSGIKCLILHTAKSSSTCMISDNPRKMNIDFPENTLENTSKDFGELKSYFHDSKRVSQVTNLVKSMNNSSSTSTLFKYLKSDNSNVETHFTYLGRNKSKVILWYTLDVLKTKYRKKFIDKNLMSQIPSNEKFVYFPLHMDMEQYPLIAAPFYTNQIEFIRSLAKSLPVDYELYVKEHPGNALRSWRKTSDYNEIMSIPNVKLFHPSLSSEELYEKCSLVITIAGTSGFEAGLFGKPSITFADLNYIALPHVHRATSLEELPETIRKMLKVKVNPSDMHHLLSIYRKNEINFDWWNFQQQINDTFFQSGKMFNIDIPISTMEKFLTHHHTKLNLLMEKHLEKLNT